MELFLLNPSKGNEGGCAEGLRMRGLLPVPLVIILTNLFHYVNDF